MKARNTLVIREAWPSSHGNCFFSVVFLPHEDQTSSTPSVAIPGWYRIKRGMYRHDVALGQSYDSQSDRITLLVASRELLSAKDVGVGQDRRMPCLFNPPSPDANPPNEYKGHSYVNGLLSLKLNRTAVVAVPIPAPVEILLHRESRCAPAFVHDTLHVYAAQYWMEGDAVRVTAGEMIGCQCRIECVDMDTRSASVYMDESLDVAKFSLPLMFPIAHLARTFSIGDNVRVLEGSLVPLELSGKTGAVVVVNESNIVVHDASSLSQVSVASGSFAPYHN